MRAGRILLSFGKRQEAEKLLRAALGDLVFAFLLDRPGNAHLFTVAHRLGALIEDEFGCEFAYNPETDAYMSDCPIAGLHSRLGMSAAFTTASTCSICGAEDFDCGHVPGYEIDRLLHRTRSSRDAMLGLVADGYPIDEAAARQAYLTFLKAVRDGELLVPRLGTSKRALARLRRRSLWGARWWLDFVARERGIEAMSYEARWSKELGLRGDLRKQSVLHDQLEGSRQILRGRLDGWREDNFMNAVADPPPPEVLGELHRRLAFTALRRAVMKVDVEELHATAIGLGAFLLQAADLILERTEREEDFHLFGDLEMTRRWHADYRDILFADPVTPARLVPFLLSIAESEQLQPLMASMFVEVALRFPNWRAMVLALTTWPQLSWGDWRIGSRPAA